MSFDTTVTDPVTTPNVTADQPLSFTVGDRTFDAASATTKIEHSDAHITTLEEENAALKLQVAQSTSIDEALAAMRATPAEPQNIQAVEQTSPVSAEQIGEIAKQQMVDFLASKQIADNATAAKDLSERTFKETGDTLKAIYGDKTDEAMATKAAEMGISTQALFDMAKSPATAQLLLQSMKVTATPSQSAPSGGYQFTDTSVTQQESFVDHSKPLTSSNIMEALSKAGAGYN